MYIYQVTHIPTRRYYIGFTDQSKTLFDSANNQDPASQFQPQTSRNSIVKEILTLCYSLSELRQKVKEIKAVSELDFSYIGYVHDEVTAVPIFKAIKLEPKKIDLKEPIEKVEVDNTSDIFIEPIVAEEIPKQLKKAEKSIKK